MAERLTEDQVKSLKKRLQQAEARLHDEIRDALLQSDHEQYADIAGLVHDRGDESVADLLADRQVALVDRQIGQLKDVENALQRISMGSYGVCDDCEGDIEPARLEAQPTAVRCTDCQRKYEQRSGVSSPRL